MYTNGKHPFFIVWNGRVGVGNLRIYSYKIYFQMKTKLKYSLDNTCRAVKTIPIGFYFLHAFRKA